MHCNGPFFSPSGWETGFPLLWSVHIVILILSSVSPLPSTSSTSTSSSSLWSRWKWGGKQHSGDWRGWCQVSWKGISLGHRLDTNILMIFNRHHNLHFFRFDISVDGGGSFKHKSVLAMPIKYSSSPGRVLGVFQLVNKLHDLPFTSNDENFLEAFAIFCGMGISNVRMYETACVAMAKQQVLLKNQHLMK